MQKPFLPALHAMRGVAAMLVVVFHAWHMGLSSVVHAPFVIKGYLWVDFFFLLSGFIIAYHYEARFNKGLRRRDVVSFYIVRAMRIFPLHIVVLGLWIAIEAVQYLREGRGFDEGRQWTDFVPNLLLMQSWLFHNTSWNPPSWSISCEWLFYLLFPLLAVPFYRRSLAFSMVVIGMMAGTLWLAAAYFSQLPLDGAEFNLGASVNGGIFRALPEFITGILICNIAAEHASWLKRYGRRIFWAAALFTGSMMVIYASDFLIVAGFALMVFGGAGIQGNPTKITGFLGDISYSVYMLHSVVIAVLAHLFPVAGLSGSEAFLLAAILFLMVILCSSVTYYLIERPCNQWAKKRYRHS